MSVRMFYLRQFSWSEIKIIRRSAKVVPAKIVSHCFRAFQFECCVSKWSSHSHFERFLIIFIYFWNIGNLVMKNKTLENLRQFSRSQIKIICRAGKAGYHCFKAFKFESFVSKALNHSHFERFLKIFLYF